LAGNLLCFGCHQVAAAHSLKADSLSMQSPTLWFQVQLPRAPSECKCAAVYVGAESDVQLEVRATRERRRCDDVYRDDVEGKDAV
jgi:hypothetical protein